MLINKNVTANNWKDKSNPVLSRNVVGNNEKSANDEWVIEKEEPIEKLDELKFNRLKLIRQRIIEQKLISVINYKTWDFTNFYSLVSNLNTLLLNDFEYLMPKNNWQWRNEGSGSHIVFYLYNSYNAKKVIDFRDISIINYSKIFSVEVIREKCISYYKKITKCRWIKKLNNSFDNLNSNSVHEAIDADFMIENSGLDMLGETIQSYLMNKNIRNPIIYFRNYETIESYKSDDWLIIDNLKKFIKRNKYFDTSKIKFDLSPNYPKKITKEGDSDGGVRYEFIIQYEEKDCKIEEIRIK